MGIKISVRICSHEKAAAEGEREMFQRINKRELLYFIKVSFVFGLLAHAYAFFNYLPSHDALNAVYASPIEDRLKYSTGRFCIPLLRKLFGSLTLPWVVGAVSLFLAACSAYLVCKILKINNKIYRALVTAFMTTNLTMTAMYATYSHEMIYDMLALFLACYAAYVICSLKRPKNAWNMGFRMLWGGVYSGGGMYCNDSRIIPIVYLYDRYPDFVSSFTVIDEW